MPSRLRVFSSSVGTKILIGLTGLALFLYLLLHIAGNLLVFAGPAIFNGYSHALLSNPLIYPVEVGLLLIFLVHIYKTVRNYLSNQQARPAAYVRKKSAGWVSRKSVASSTMIFSGLWLLVFVIIHVRGFKFGPEYVGPNGTRDLYRLEMENFSNPLTVAFYVLSMLVVGSHLWHGILSGFQSLGTPNPSRAPRAQAAAKTIAVLIAGGFIVIALWAYFTGGVRS
ncbi:MAG: succinate dehydrogenase cytochrome b subunit [Betaproteobacteria bacterium]